MDAEPLGLDPENLFNVRFTLEEDPQGLPLRVSKFSVHKTEVAWLDSTEAAIVNKAGTVFLPGLSRTRAITRLEVTKRWSIDDFGNIDIESIVDHCNSAEWTPKWTDAAGIVRTWPAYPAATVYLDEVRADGRRALHPRAGDLHVPHRQEGRQLQRPSPTNGQYVGWVKRVPNMGPVFKDSSGKLRAMTDDFNVPTGQAGLLDADGNKLATGSWPLLLPFYVVPTADFSALNLFSS